MVRCCSPLSLLPLVAAAAWAWAAVFGARCDTVAIAAHTPTMAARTHVPTHANQQKVRSTGNRKWCTPNSRQQATNHSLCFGS
uniref:Putative secreted protein n=1 Tax=Anopheles darlingi TaxID=43151 RepID=A0A2M4D3X0_ANODA